MDERLVIAGDEETGDMYLCALLDDDPRGHDPELRPIVRIERVLRYPNQRAIMHPDTPHEVPPLREGLCCRLDLIREAAAADQAFGTYEESLRAAQRQALLSAQTDGERAVILRHMQGDIRGRRAIVTFRPWELQRITIEEASHGIPETVEQ